MIVQQVDT